MYLTYEELKLSGELVNPHKFAIRLYLTYEELKLFNIASYCLFCQLYLTYEELKLSEFTLDSGVSPAGLYLTYEELKHSLSLHFELQYQSVVPYL